MKLRAFITHSLLSVTLLAVVTLAASIFALPGNARAQPEPTMVISPSSGPCDAALLVTGSGYPVPAGPLDNLILYLVEPGTADINMGSLNPASPDGDGAFSQWVGMREHGCEAAALDSQAEQPSGYLLIAVARRGDTSLQAGDGIPNIIATAQYRYTTTAPHIPTETLQISPSTGPCDGSVEIVGSGFEPGLEVVLKLGRPGSDDTLGTLASAVADADGRFTVGFALGELGCQAAELNVQFGDPTRPQLTISAERAVAFSTPVPLAGYPTPMPVRIDTLLTTVGYSYTTTEAGGGTPPQALPSTGSGPQKSMPLVWLALMGVFAGVGVSVLAVSLYVRRTRT